MADYGERQKRMQASVPRLGPVALLSAEAREYTDSIAAQQAAAANDPHLNGGDAARRLKRVTP